MKFSPYSFSKINSFMSCPKKFELSYIEKIRVFVPNIASERGSYIHTLLENKTKNKQTQFTFNVMTEKDLEICDKIYYDYTHSDNGKKYFDPKNETYAEVEFGVKKTKEDFEVCSYYSKSALFRGKIDHQIIHDDWIEALDWKTGKVTNFPAPLQLVIYAVYLFMEYPHVNKVRTAFVYVEHGNEEKEYIFFREHFNALLKKVVEKIINVETAKKFPKNETKLCEYCDYRKKGYCDPETVDEFNDKINDMVKPFRKRETEILKENKK